MDNFFIKTKNLTYIYGKEKNSKPALKNIDVGIKKGEFVAILGENGSGKSTFARLLNALIIPTDGEVFIKGINTKDSTKVWDIRQTVGMVFQNPDNQLVATIVEDDVAFGPENLGIKPDEIRKRVDMALKAVDMYEYRFKEPHRLSGGQKQRVAIAGIIAMKPECIVLDEPTAMLDPLGRSEVMETIVRLNKEEGITIILITHFMEEAVLADRVIVMSKGEIKMDGTPKSVFSDVEKIRSYGLDVPQVTELSYLLRQDGINIPPDILTVDEMVDGLCQLK
ncbi:MAG: energy-coupling factor transporter ATPase [Thermoanaerobacteraceae bacterium]|nr:energy-coupling factor transporter ATPase [Thermoanaerobacteraceae bacterium]